jgi:hypothetical protein
MRITCSGTYAPSAWGGGDNPLSFPKMVRRILITPCLSGCQCLCPLCKAQGGLLAMDNTCSTSMASSRLCLLLLVCGATAQWDYAQHGANWGAAYPACKSGAAPVLQSPIDIPSMREYFNVQDADESVEEQPHVQYENRVSTCSANAVQKGKDFAGGDLAQALLSKADITQCAPLCCKMAGCLGFTYVSVAPSDFGKCKKGQPCCFFKNVLNTPRAASECDCAAITESPTPPPPPSPPTPAPPPPTPRPASYAPVFTRAKDCTTPTRVTNGHSWEMQFNSTACTGTHYLHSIALSFIVATSS